MGEFATHVTARFTRRTGYGDSDISLVFVPGYVSHVDLYDDPAYPFAPLVEQLAQQTRLILWDKRGTGLSDPVTRVPTLDERRPRSTSGKSQRGARRTAVPARRRSTAGLPRDSPSGGHPDPVRRSGDQHHLADTQSDHPLRERYGSSFLSASRAAALGRRGGGKMGPRSSGTP